MGGSAKKRRQETAETTSRQAAETERGRATELHGELQQRKAIVGSGVPEDLESTRAGARDLRETGGFKPETLEPIRAGYQDFATTGGISTPEREAFLRRSTAPVAAMVSRNRDELQRQKSLQGGYAPGFGASQSRLFRQGANAGAEASLGANVELANTVRSGRMAGLSGLQSVAEAEQRGRVAGQDALNRVSQFGVAALNELDVTELRNRLQSGQMSQADAALLTQIASQNKTLFDNIMQGISTVGGATAGVLGAL